MSDNYRHNNQLYIIGSNATKLDTHTEIETRTTEDDRQARSVRKQPVGRQYRYKMKLACLLTITMIMCIGMIKTQLTVTARSYNIVRLEKELNSLKKQNSLLVDNISNNIKLEQVYEIATTKLGMTMPNKNQIGSINAKAGSYTQQYVAIEEVAVKKEGISNILGFILAN